ISYLGLYGGEGFSSIAKLFQLYSCPCIALSGVRSSGTTAWSHHRPIRADSTLSAFLPSFVSSSMTLLFGEAKVPVPDSPRKPPQRIIQLERCDRISSPPANAIKNPILGLAGAEI